MTQLDFFSSLTEREKLIFNAYKCNSEFAGECCFANYVNDTLRNGKEFSGEWLSAVTCLDEITKKNALDEETTVYRATFDDFVLPFIKDGIYNYPAFMSTTIPLSGTPNHFANSFGWRIPSLLRIKCPSKTLCAPMEGNADFGVSENEILFGRNGVYKLIEKRAVTDRTEIANIMTKFYSQGINKLLDFSFEFIEYQC